MGQGSFGTDEASIFKIIGESPPEHLEKVNEIYTIKREVTLLGALKTEVGGDAGKAARYAVGMKLKPFRTAAEHIEETCAGFGTGKFQVTHYLWPSYSGIIFPQSNIALFRYRRIQLDLRDSSLPGDHAFGQRGSYRAI